MYQLYQTVGILTLPLTEMDNSGIIIRSDTEHFETVYEGTFFPLLFVEYLN